MIRSCPWAIAGDYESQSFVLSLQVSLLLEHYASLSQVANMRRSRYFCQGGSRSVWQKKKSSDVFVCFFVVFFSPQLILQKSNGQFQRNISFFKVPEGVQLFPGGGVQLFPGGGSNCLFPVETHITCDFPGGVWTPCPPIGSALG